MVAWPAQRRFLEPLWSRYGLPKAPFRKGLCPQAHRNLIFGLVRGQPVQAGDVRIITLGRGRVRTGRRGLGVLRGAVAAEERAQLIRTMTVPPCRRLPCSFVKTLFSASLVMLPVLPDHVAPIPGFPPFPGGDLLFAPFPSADASTSITPYIVVDEQAASVRSSWI